MRFFKRREPWTLVGIPDLSFGGPTDFVDIGFLGGDEHREAFASIFAKMLADNRDTLTGRELVAIEARRPFTSSTLLPTLLLEIDSAHFARELYDSRNEKVFLRLSCEAGEAKLGVAFDDPAFWLEDASA
jgi:hypothetical protein